MPGDGCLTYAEGNKEPLAAGFDQKGHAVDDIFGACFEVMKGTSVSLSSLYKGKKESPRS